jgi:hypothetical protein
LASPEADRIRLETRKIERGGRMATFRDEQMRTGWSRTRWLLVIGVLVAIAVAVILVLVYSGGGSGGGTGGY